MTKQLIATMTLFAFAAIAPLTVVEAQNSSTTEIHGTVTDSSGAVIPGAMVIISRGGLTLTSSTNEYGQYAFTNLSPGHYRVRVHFGGFAAFDRSNFVVTQGRETEADAQLEVKEVRQAVSVYE